MRNDYIATTNELLSITNDNTEYISSVAVDDTTYQYYQQMIDIHSYILLGLGMLIGIGVIKCMKF